MYLFELGKYKWRKSNKRNQNNGTMFQWRAADNPSGRKTCDCQNVSAVNSHPVRPAAVLPSDPCKNDGSGECFALFCFFLQLCPVEVSTSYARVVVPDLKDIWKTEAKNHLHTTESKSDNTCWFWVTMAMGIPSHFSHTQLHLFCRAIK